MQRRFPSLTRWQQFTSQALPRLRELVRRFHIKLKEDNTCNPSKAPELEAYTALCLSVRALSFQQVQPGRDPCAGRLHQKAKLRSSGLWHLGHLYSEVQAVSLPSVWSSPEPLAARRWEVIDHEESCRLAKCSSTLSFPVPFLRRRLGLGGTSFARPRCCGLRVGARHFLTCFAERDVANPEMISSSTVKEFGPGSEPVGHMGVLAVWGWRVI